MVPHPHGHHPPPPLPYFAPFHIPPHPEYPSSVELTPLTNYSEQSPQASNQYQPQQPEEHPKVVVPNIEEELNFLSQGECLDTKRCSGVFSGMYYVSDATRSSVPNNQHHGGPQHQKSLNSGANKPPEKPTGAGSGFMSSYLKFLQGERDTSPPPAMRGGGNRKQSTWPRAPMKGIDDKSPDSNGVPTPTNPQQPMPSSASIPPLPTTLPRLSTQGDPQDDPRYFPLPKERKRNSFDSSDDGFSSDDDFFGHKKKHQAAAAAAAAGQDNKEVKDKDDKGKEKDREKKKDKIKADKPDKPKKPKGDKPPKPEKEKKHKEKKDKKKDKDNIDDLPKRESTKRAAKKKGNLSDMGKDDEPEEPPEFQDSDSDPAWTPAANTDPEDVNLPLKSKRRGRPCKSKL